MKNSWPYTNAVDPKIYKSRTDWPKISIVTPSHNQGQYIEETILSILNQNYPNLEYIIIDGGSTDNTVEIIKKYEDRINYWVSEKDRGQSHAINKGLKQCTGEIFNWINSDDYLARLSLYKIANSFQKEINCIIGNVINFDQYSTQNFKNENINFQGLWNKNSQLKFHQPGLWLNMDVFKKIKIKEYYHYCFDFDMLIQLLFYYRNFKYLDTDLVFFRLHQNSKTVSEEAKFANERHIIYNELSLYAPTKLRKLAKKKLADMEWDIKMAAILNANNGQMIKLYKLLLLGLKFPTLSFTRQYIGGIKKIVIK